MKKKLITGILTATLTASLVLSGCGNGNTTVSQTSTEQTSKASEASSVSAPDKTESDTSAASNTDVPTDKEKHTGAAWIDSGLYGTFKEMGEIRPQDDFASYVNRAWAESVQIPQGQSNISSRVEHDLENNALKIDLLKGEKKDDEELTAAQNFFRLLLDWDMRNEVGYSELKTYTDAIMAISDIDELTAFLSDSDKNLYGYPMIETTVMADDKDALNNVVCLAYPTLMSGMDDSFYADGEDGPMRQYFRGISEYMMTRLGYTEAEAKEIFNRCVGFESNFVPAIAEFKERTISEGPAPARYNPYISEELDKIFTNIPVRDFYTKLGISLDDKVILYNPKAFEIYDGLYTNEQIEEMKSWILVWTLLKTCDFIDRETCETAAKASAPLTGTDSMLPDDQYALKAIYDLIPGIIDKLYAEYCFDPEVKNQVTELTNKIISAYREMLKEEDWLTDATKAAAIEKLDNIKVNICYPDNMPDFTDVKVPTKEDGGTLLKAYKSVLSHLIKANGQKLLQKNDGTYWNTEIKYSELGAAYMANENSININAAICGGDYFDASWPVEKKLGGVCMVIGHEITHAFDTEGSKYDKDGNSNNWWQPEDSEAFQKRVDKLIAYYSDLIPVPQLSDKPYGEDGALFVSVEAIADLGSMKCLLSIAKDIEGFDYNMFFTQIATIQKNARYEAAEMNYLSTDPHPVECYRCNIPVQNFDEFINTYGVKEGDGMYLAPEDRITVW